MKQTLFFIFLLLSGDVFAAVVTESEARQAAVAFMNGRGKTLTESPVRLSARKSSRRMSAASDYYVFNVGDGQGFVVVSGDDRTEPILGYADEGAIIEDEMPDALQAWLDGYSKQLAWLDEAGFDKAFTAESRSVQTRSSGVKTALTPLIATRWNQGAPYNLYCPVKGTGDDAVQTVTGCVATSMAQVMCFHQHPLESPAIPGYTTRNTLFALSDLPATTFSWNDMQSTYASSTDLTVAANNAVATLMEYCGWSLQMNYNVSSERGSSAYNVSIAEALKQYFGYSNDVRTVFRSNYSYLEWVDLLYAELSAGRPVVYGGQSAGGGHSFICDGYEGDDNFHFNWGWGGSSDGYFRLSMLTPWEQGIGGSSTLDGFNYGQEAVIGIHSGDGSAARYVLSLNAFQFASDDATVTKTFTRDSASDGFTGISLYAMLYSYCLGTTSWDYAVRLSDESGNIITDLTSSTLADVPFNTKQELPLSDLTISSSVPAGTYYIDLVSGMADGDYMLPCSGSEAFRVKAEVTETTLTLTAEKVSLGDGVLPTCSGFTVETETPTQGYEVELTAQVTGGSQDYMDRLLLKFDDKIVMGRQADIPAGTTVDAPFVFTPKESGDKVLAIFAGSTKLYEMTLTVAESDATDDLTLTLNPVVTNVVDGKCYGNAVRVTVNVGNTSTTNSYVGKLNCSLRKYDSMDAAVDEYVDATVQTKSLVVGKESVAAVDYAFDGLDADAFYMMRITYTPVNSDHETFTGRYGMAEGFLMYNADGTTAILPKTETINPDAALCIDLTALSDLSNVEVGTNPNCLYLLNSDATVPKSLADANVVKGGVAEKITLTDAKDFWSPIDFTAKQMSYSRTFTTPASSKGGWSTIMLPFDVETVTVGEKEVDWFHSASDTGKNFWVKTFTGDASGKVYFDFATKMKANVPYIIAVPGDDWGEDWKMTDKTVTFYSTATQTMKATEVMKQSGDVYNFYGTTRSEQVKDVYMLNDAGTTFAKQTEDAASGAFRAWFGGSSINSLMLPSLSIGRGSPTGIEAIDYSPLATDHSVYDLQGRRMVNGECTMFNGQSLKKGLYIQNGKKLLVR